MTWRRSLLILLLWTASLVVASSAIAQTVADDAAVRPNRDYLALLPFETIDTGNANIILRFTDLVLPGNGGREWRIGRVFNNGLTGPQRWRFGIEGVPMQVVERPRGEPPFDPINPIAAEWSTTPHFVMLDGSWNHTTYIYTPNDSDPVTLRLVQTADFWHYDRDTRTLRLSNGLVATYDEQGHLIEIVDAYPARDGQGHATNGVLIDWAQSAQGLLTIEQRLGNGQSRWLDITLTSEGQWQTLTFDGSTWTYHYDDPADPTLITEVDVPLLDNPWVFSYSTAVSEVGKIQTIVTPQGGMLEYTYADQDFYDPLSQTGSSPARVLATRTVTDNTLESSTWTFTHALVSAQASESTEVTLPSERRIVYTYRDANTPSTLTGGWLLTSRAVYDVGAGTPTEREEFIYTQDPLPAARQGLSWGIYRLASRATTRSNQTYTTQYTYSVTEPPLGDPPCTSYNFYNFHHPITIIESRPGVSEARRTDRTYRHYRCDVLYHLALPYSDSQTVSGQTVTRSWTYDDLTGFQETENRYGILTAFAPDTFGNVATATKANGTATAMTYDWGVLDDTVTAEFTISRAVDPRGFIASETVAGRTTTYDYDVHLRPTLTTRSAGSVPTSWTYHPSGLTIDVQRGSAVETITVDGFGRTTERASPMGIKTRTDYDADGRVTQRSVPFTGSTPSLWTQYTYDALGRVIEERYPDDHVQTTQYDDGLNRVTVTDAEGKATTYAYEAFGHPDDARLVSVTDADNEVWTYTYDTFGNLRTVVPPTGSQHTRTWVYDTRGLLTSETHPESGTVQYPSYDDAGVLLQRIDAKGTSFVYGHDGNDRVTSVTAGGRITTIAYEPGSDNRASVNNGDVATTFHHDDAGRLEQRTDVIGTRAFGSTYTYDGFDRVESITYPTGRVVTHERNNDGQLTHVFEDTTPNRNHAVGMTYHPSGGLAGYTAGNNVVTVVTQSPERQWVTSITAGGWTLGYGNYDAVGNVRTITNTRPGQSPTTEQFTYDDLHRLASVNANYGGAAFTYDAHGNRQSDGLNTYAYQANTLRLTSVGSVPYDHDPNGNLTQRGGEIFTYTAENMLASAVTGSGTTTYAYDGDQWRAKRTTSTGTTYFLRGLQGELLTEWTVPTSGSATARDYVYADGRLLSAIGKTAAAPPADDAFGTIVPNGPNVTATLSTPGRRLLLSFSGIAGHRYRAQAWVTSGQFGCANWLELRTAAGDLVGNASSGPSCNDQLLDAIVLPSSGTYYIVIDPAGTNTGVATVRLLDIYGVVTPNGPKLVVPANTNGQTLYVEFAGQQGWQFSVLTQKNVSGSNCTYTVAIRTVYGSTIPTTSESTGCDWLLTKMESAPLPTTRLHILVLTPVATSGNNSADLWLYQYQDVTTPIAPDGQPNTTPLPRPAQRALLPFTGTAGQRLAARAQVTSGSFGCSWWLSIRKPDGTNLPGSVGICNGSVAFHEPVIVPSTGTYRVVVDPKGTSTGTASVRLFPVDPDVTGTLTINAAATPVSLPTVGQQAALTLAGTSGQKVTVRLTNNTIGLTEVRLKRANGTSLALLTSAASSFNLVQVTLPANETYTVAINPSDMNVGSISVQVTSP